MTYVISQSCCNDAICVAVCPVDAIHPTPDEPGYATTDQLYIDPARCIDCNACAEVCPVRAIHRDHDVPAHLAPYAEVNAGFFAAVRA
jgi:ferredoxin--NADP+ reductase